MAAGMLPKPGTKCGPCSEPCQHTDCAATRKQSAELCSWCDEPIGYGTRFFVDGDEYVHELCELQAIEEGRV